MTEETLVGAGAGAARLPKPSRRTLAVGGVLLVAAAAAAALMLGGRTAPPLAPPAPPQSELARLMSDVASQIEAQAPFAAGGAATLTGAAASGERLVLRMRLSEDVLAEDIAAAEARLAQADASELCGNTDMRWLIEQGGTIERRYLDSGGDALTTQTSGCAGQRGAEGRATIPVAM
ncbi:hypothetical protein [Allosphingosinicella sp.]|uniref:hypothetical protein n=1 Tax=Allosphingosinicella sp. TaxID=2823234 RepID=UPI002EF863F2